MISFDRDVSANVKVVQRQVTLDNIVGSIAAHDPDFEFANFTIGELAEIAARIDEAKGSLGDAVRKADWTGVTSAKAFETKYVSVSAWKPSTLKGKEWGRALGAYAIQYQTRQDTGLRRRVMQDIAAAFRGRIANYDSQRDRSTFDPNTFQEIPRTRDVE